MNSYSLSRGANEEKNSLLFSAFDSKGRGYITREDFQKVTMRTNPNPTTNPNPIPTNLKSSPTNFKHSNSNPNPDPNPNLRAWNQLFNPHRFSYKTIDPIFISKAYLLFRHSFKML
jgi:hypothetical protein